MHRDQPGLLAHWDRLGLPVELAIRDFLDHQDLWDPRGLQAVVDQPDNLVLTDQ